METRLTDVENSLADIQKKIDNGYVIESVSSSGSGFVITFVGSGGSRQTYTITPGVDGAPGATGAPGKSAPLWQIDTLGMWTSCPVDGSSSTCISSGRPASDKSPGINNGFWEFYKWNESKRGYDTIPSDYVADSLSTYVADHGQYYELFVPMQKRDSFGNPMVNEAGRPVTELVMIKLPKWLQDAEPPVFFKILGYAEIINTDTFKLQDLNLTYYRIDSIYNFTDRYRVTADSSIWKWETKPRVPILGYDYVVPELNRNIAIVFSINRPKTFIESLSSSEIELHDSKGDSLRLVRIENPKSLSKGLITKGGTNNDTLYYARMVSDGNKYTPGQAIPSSTADIYYRMVIQDSIKSDLASHTISLRRDSFSTTTLKSIVVRNSNNMQIWPISGGSNPDTFVVQAGVSHSVSLSPADFYYDHYVATNATGLTPSSVTLTGNTAPYYNYKRFIPASSVTFRLGVYKLQFDGKIYTDTIVIRSLP
ncbi:MAG: hypothetical protein LBI58_03420 [Tannerellaceae bacterium]|jgi:hypothetical protein|nr:hypothetical protein [Tannerellaceae bacterium]